MNDTFWKIRAQKYNKLKWVKDKYLLEQLIHFCNLKKFDQVLEVGCGSGIVANVVLNKVKTVVAMDKSQAMLAKAHFIRPILTMHRDLQAKPCITGFDKIIARMVFHHVEKLDVGFQRCYQMLANGGWFIIQEGGIHPSENAVVQSWFNNMMKKKEKRHNFTVTQLQTYFKMCGFHNITTKIIVDKDFSVNNWLQNSGLPTKIQHEILMEHINAPVAIKKAYNMKIKQNHVTLHSRVLLIKGQKFRSNNENSTL